MNWVSGGCTAKTGVNWTPWLSPRLRCSWAPNHVADAAAASLRWRHNDHDGVSNHQPHGCLFNRLFRRRSKKTSKIRVTGLCAGNSPEPVNSPHKGPVTRKMFPFDDVIMWRCCFVLERPIWQEQSLKGLGQWCRVCIRNSLHVYYIRIWMWPRTLILTLFTWTSNYMDK